jgi:hypothetical protein
MFDRIDIEDTRAHAEPLHVHGARATAPQPVARPRNTKKSYSELLIDKGDCDCATWLSSQIHQLQIAAHRTCDYIQDALRKKCFGLQYCLK